MAPLAGLQLNVGVSKPTNVPGELGVPGEIVVGGLAAKTVWQNSQSDSTKVVFNRIFMGR